MTHTSPESTAPRTERPTSVTARSRPRSPASPALRLAPLALLLTALLALGACGTQTAAMPGARPAPPQELPEEPEAVETPEAPAADTVDPTPEPAPDPQLAPTLGISLDTVQAGPFDQGKMWTFDAPPVGYFQETYGIDADSAWFADARLGALRIPGCSASFVSPNGLVLTNHHCAREYVSEVSGEGENLLDEGFYARALAEERALEEFEADQLVEIIDVTAEMDDAVGDRTGEERAETIAEKTEEITERLLEERGGEDAGFKVQVINLYNGGLYSAYVFRTYTNARLVMAPELQIGFYGGDPDNFTYPRYNLDFAFLRLVDDDGEPVRSEHYFPFSTRGVAAGDPIFIVGNPGSTSRLQTVAELNFRRDVSDRGVLEFLKSRAEVLEGYIEAYPETAEEYDLRNTLFGALNSIKAYQGQLEGLADPVILARRMDTQQDLQAAIDADPALQARFGGLIEEMTEIQARKRDNTEGYRAFLALTAGGYASPTLHRAFLAFQILNARQQGAPEEATAGLLEQLKGVASVPTELDELLAQARIEDFTETFGTDERWVLSLLGSRTPEGAASYIVNNSVMSDSAEAVDAVERGLVDANDPALRAVGFYVPALVRFQQGLQQYGTREQEIAALLGRARYEIYGTDVPPDATFSLRIADGVVEGYPYNGTEAPPHTTFFGLYDRHHSFKELYAGDPTDSPWWLPERWQTPPEGLDLTTPVNFVSTADIIGGNSGSPVLNAELEIVGVVFDGNIESLPGDYIYLPDLNRSVTVDSRGILEALDVVYDLDRLVREVTEGTLFETEAAADAGR
jgi:hypothetical protein